jgi:TrpR family transcriptional regulator, trp operon repressor
MYHPMSTIMTSQPQYSDWPSFVELVRQAVNNGQDEQLLTMLLTSDERDALISRANIIVELLKGDLSQRQISQLLGVGIATITRGSNELKSIPEQQKQQLTKLFFPSALSDNEKSD